MEEVSSYFSLVMYVEVAVGRCRYRRRCNFFPSAKKKETGIQPQVSHSNTTIWKSLQAWI